MSDAAVPPTRMVPQVGVFALQPGMSIGRYRIESVLGQGGFGITYRAHDSQLNRDTAIKEYLPASLAVRQGGVTVLPRSTEVAQDFTWGRQRFVEEGRTLASLHDAPAIVRVYDFLESNGTAYIVMELVQGETLDARLKRQGPLTPSQVDAILWPLLDGLSRVHDAGFLHRDIKPANILVKPDDSPTLIDFGASRAAMAGRSAALTAIFTPGFAAAEQMTSAKQGPWTDIYGVAATLYTAITGSVPPSAFDRMLDDTCLPLMDIAPLKFNMSRLAGIDAGLAVRAVDRPQSIAAWRDLFSRTATPRSDATVVMRHSRPTDLPNTPAAALPFFTTVPGSRKWLFTGTFLALALLGAGGYLALTSTPGTQAIALQNMNAEDLERALDARRKADATAAEKRRIEEEVQKKAVADAENMRAADAALQQAQQQRQVAEAELARIRADIEEQKKAATSQADIARQAAAQDAQRQAEAEAAASRRREEAAQAKAAFEAEAKRLADQALVEARAAREKAEAESQARAQAQADAEARRRAEFDAATKEKADAEAKKLQAEAEQKKLAEAAENSLRLTPVDRQRLQVALSSQGFDTRGTDGAFGPRTRDMITAWQKARNQPVTGFLSAVQQQQLLREGTAALQKYEDEQKKADEDSKAKAASAALPSTIETSPKPVTPTVTAPPDAVDIRFSGGLIMQSISRAATPIVLSVNLRLRDRRLEGEIVDRACGTWPAAFTVSASGQISGTLQLTEGAYSCAPVPVVVTGSVGANEIELKLSSHLARGANTLKAVR